MAREKARAKVSPPFAVLAKERARAKENHGGLFMVILAMTNGKMIIMMLMSGQRMSGWSRQILQPNISAKEKARARARGKITQHHRVKDVRNVDPLITTVMIAHGLQQVAKVRENQPIMKCKPCHHHHHQQVRCRQLPLLLHHGLLQVGSQQPCTIGNLTMCRQHGIHQQISPTISLPLARCLPQCFRKAVMQMI